MIYILSTFLFIVFSSVYSLASNWTVTSSDTAYTNRLPPTYITSHPDVLYPQKSAHSSSSDYNTGHTVDFTHLQSEGHEHNNNFFLHNNTRTTSSLNPDAKPFIPKDITPNEKKQLIQEAFAKKDNKTLERFNLTIGQDGALWCMCYESFDFLKNNQPPPLFCPPSLQNNDVEWND